MEGSLQDRVSSQPSCSYDAACRQQLRQPQSCRDTRQQLSGCSHVQVQCLNRRRDRRLRSWFSSSIVLVVLAATLSQPSHAFVLSGDAQDRAFEDMSMLARAGKLLTVAVSDAASAIGATKRKSIHVDKRTMLMSDKKVRHLQTHGTTHTDQTTLQDRNQMPCLAPLHLATWPVYANQGNTGLDVSPDSYAPPC